MYIKSVANSCFIFLEPKLEVNHFRKKFVFRQFHIEGFINQYVLEQISDDGKTLVFDSEQFENAPPGWKARITYKIVDDNNLEESFDLATPGKALQCYILNFLERKK